VEFRGISQTQMYTSGAYVDEVLLAMRERSRIDAVLAQYRTKPRSAVTGSDVGAAAGIGAAAEAAEGSGAAADDDGATSAGYYPYRPHCSACERDLTTVTGYVDETTELSYTCACGHAEIVKLAEHQHGKLVWKVDWPMRWAYEGVIFEPSGADHQAPGSSFVVGGELVGEIFGGWQPIGPGYAFVGISGMAKMSSSRGSVPTPADALEIMEEPVLRWLYARRRPQQSFTIAFDQEIQRLYDEWDAAARKTADGTAAPLDASQPKKRGRAACTMSTLLRSRDACRALVYCGGTWARVTGRVMALPDGVTQVMVTFFPLGRCDRMPVREAGEETCCPATPVITSPAVSPAPAAGVPQSAARTSAPDAAGAMCCGIPAYTALGTQLAGAGRDPPPRGCCPSASSVW
jgi:hypothetical protein